MQKEPARTIAPFAASNLLRVATRYTGTVKPTENSSHEVTPVENRRSCILGIDYGRARIGLAVADARTALARPLDTFERINRNEDIRRLRQIVRANGVNRIVVGLPLRLDGTHGEMAEEASRFAERVRKQLGLPVEMMDERLTSWEAERLLEEQAGRVLHDPAKSGHGKRKQAPPRSSVDAIAAAVILKEYLEQQAAKGSA
jgi:putative Holliday junction resolvase